MIGRHDIDKDKPKPRVRKTERNITDTKRHDRKVVGTTRVRKEGHLGVKKH
jgi:hypothetical protein